MSFRREEAAEEDRRSTVRDQEKSWALWKTSVSAPWILRMKQQRRWPKTSEMSAGLIIIVIIIYYYLHYYHFINNIILIVQPINTITVRLRLILKSARTCRANVLLLRCWTW